MKCPCQSEQTYDNCCGKYLEQGHTAPTAESLMRARYSAFATGKIEFLTESHDPRTREELDVEETKNWSKQAKWLGLNVIEVTDGDKNDTDGSVEFIAKYEQDGELHHHHEHADFFKKAGIWYYKDGKVVGTETFERQTPKVGRNDPCSCGSGKKFKKCCAL